MSRLINPAVLKNSLVFSIIGHFAVFSVFSLSFGSRLPSAATFAPVSFYGEILNSWQVMSPLVILSPPPLAARRRISMENRSFTPPKAGLRMTEQIDVDLNGYIKPALTFGFNAQKSIFAKKISPSAFPLKASESSVVFHPALPYDFALYFKDRQVARVELEFNISLSGGRNFIDIKRKITSGNPEVDLSIMRNISHYLSMQQTRFPVNSRQTIKIDLSGNR